MSLVKQIYREEIQAGSPFAEAITLAKSELPQAGRFLVGQDIMNAVDRMEKIPIDDLLKAMPYARPPFASTWIEWMPPGGGGHTGYMILTDDEPQSFRFRRYSSMRGLEGVIGATVFAELDWVRVTAAGYSTDVPPMSYPPPQIAPVNSIDQFTDETFAADIRMAVSDVIGMLLIINSPSGVVEIAEAPDTAREDARRKRDGRMPLPNLRAIRLNIGRVRQLSNGTDGDGSEGRPRAEHLVRGHFKMIKGEMCWWSPHPRNLAGKTPTALPRDYSVRV